MGTLVLSWYSYLLICLIAFFSVAVGIYFGCFNKRKTTKNEYLLGGRNMKPFPVAISLIASANSSDFLLGIASDVYTYGAAMLLRLFSMIILCVLTIYVFLPVFFNLKVTTTYKYLELRFDRRTKLLVSFIFCLCFTFYVSVILYVPSLALATVTGFKTHTMALVVSGVCIFYTSIGGLKAVVWTDNLQFLVVAVILMVVLFLGVGAAGGWVEVWSKAYESGRLDIFEFDLDPTRRDSFWIIVVGSTLNVMSYTSVDQSVMQKIMSVSSLSSAKLALVYFCIGGFMVQTTCVVLGLVIYAMYGTCDPLSTGRIERSDQLLLLLLIDMSNKFPGLISIFIIAIFTASLSAQSAFTNCIAGTICEDFLTIFLSKNTAERKMNMILKSIVVAVGVVSTFLIFVVENLGDIFPLIFGLVSMAWGPILGVFTLGFTCPKANSKGAFYGTVCGFLTILSIAIPATYYERQGLFSYPTKPLSREGCSLINQTTFSSVQNFNATLQSLSENEVFWIFRISFYYYTLIGVASTVIAGVVISYLTNKNDPPVDRSLISPVCQFLISGQEVEDESGNAAETEGLTMCNTIT